MVLEAVEEEGEEIMNRKIIISIFLIGFFHIMLFFALFLILKLPNEAFGYSTASLMIVTLGVYVYYHVNKISFGKFFIGMIIVYGVLATCVSGSEKWMYSNNQPTIKELCSLVSEASDINAIETPAIYGKVLIWDTETDKLSPAQAKIPKELRAISCRDEITVFLLMKPRQECVGSYSMSNLPAYKQYVEAIIVLWPDKRILGKKEIESLEPYQERAYRNVPEYGDLNRPIAAWISQLPVNEKR